MKTMNEYDRDSIMDPSVFEEIFMQEDPVYQAQMIASLSMRAKELGVKKYFDDMIKAYRKAERKQMVSERSGSISLLDNWTNFTGGGYDNMRCKSWVAADDGIYRANSDTSALDTLACYHPILPIERLKNLETGEEQIKLAYKRNGRWQEIIVPKTLVTSASKIVALSGRGISVTSENAKNLVKFLADVENSNEESIKVQYSSSKLGWIGEGFLPYDSDIVFDGDTRFGQLFESISTKGDRAEWYQHVIELRKTKRIEIKFMLAASFASVLLPILGSLPFFVDLWGETEGGKSVTLMLAASVWANPDESRYIGDFKTTDTALEARADMLNNLPMMLDDTSKTSSRIRENFEGIVYDLCSGKGKSRSNKELGMNRENRWRNCILTNGERPLASYVQQGGAINRILEVECGDRVYKNPQHTAELLKKNYGFAGRDFIQTLKFIGNDQIRAMQKEIQEQIFDNEKMQKQSISLSVILTADKIATEYLFKDRQYISLEEVKEVLIDRNELSDNERCYHYISDKVAMNQSRFDLTSNIEKWGILEGEYAVFYTQAFDELCQQGGFSKKSFLSWASRKGLIQQDSAGKTTKVKSFAGKKIRCVFLKLADAHDIDGDGTEHLGDGTKVDKDGFVSLDDENQMELPFLDQE